MISINKIRSNTLYFILFTACFNDILRIGNSKITLFRILMFLGLALCITFIDKIVKYFLSFIGLAVVAFAQNMYFIYINEYGIGLLPKRYIEYMYYYFCITSVLLMIVSIKEIEGKLFYINFSDFIEKIIILYFCVFLIAFIYPDIKYILNINNINDYGAMLSASFPFLIIKEKKNVFKKIKWCSLEFALILLVLLNDCKLALISILFQLFLLALLKTSKKSRVIVCVALIFIISSIFSFIISNDITINGYNIEKLVVETFDHIIKHELYPQSNTSQSYRANVLIVISDWLLSTKLIGIGTGNTGRLLRVVLGKNNLYTKWMKEIAICPHNALLEFLLDWGLVALIVYCVLFGRFFKYMFKDIIKKKEYVLYTLVIGSSVFWMQEPSIVYTDYFIFIILFFTLKFLKSNKEEIGNYSLNFTEKLH